MIVHGDSHNRDLIGLVGLNPEYTLAWARKNIPDFKDNHLTGALLSNQSLIQEILKDMKNIAKESGLEPAEEIKGLLLVESLEQFNTPTYKIRRQLVLSSYGHQLEDLHREIRKSIDKSERTNSKPDFNKNTFLGISSSGEDISEHNKKTK